MKRISLIIIASFLVVVFSYAQQGKEKMKVTDLVNIKTVGSVTLNNDGSKAVFTVQSIEPDGEQGLDYKYVTQLWVVNTDGAQAPRQLTFSPEGASQPTFSPDGKQVAFVRSAAGKPQIFLLSLEGGEPQQLTKYKYGAFSPKWNWDGSQLLFTSSVSLKELLTDSLLNPSKELPSWNYEKPGFTNNSNLKQNQAKPDPNGSLQEIRAYLDNNEKDKKAKVITKLQFQEEATTSNEISFSHIFLIDVKPNAVPKALTHGFYSFSSPQFVGKSDEIIVDAKINENMLPDRVLESSVYIINRTGTILKKLLDKKDIRYNNEAVSPSGKYLAYQYGGTGFVNVPALAIMPVNGQEVDAINISFDRNKGSFSWSPDEKYLYFTASSNGGVVLCRLDMATKKIETLTDFNTGVNAYAFKNNNLVFAKNDITNPSELFAADLTAKNTKQLSNFNTAWVQKKLISLPEKHTFTNDKGMTVEYWVMKPINYQAGKKYPLLLEIHGGPSAMWGPGESSMWHEYQYFCSQGYGVVYSNPRGSGGYGTEFLKGNVEDWGKGPTNDVLTALDKTVAEGWADTSKLLVTGGSYAGYLVSWIVGHDHRFKAACSQRGVYDLGTFFGEANAWRLVPNYFGGYPWEEKVKPILERESPITYVQNITTPYIIFHGESDLRTGTIQGEMLYKSLKVLGRPVEYVRHPGATHEITRSGNNRQRIDQMLRTYEFFERWIE
ncbi:S9 family peptidase [Chitinophagaceae bacterium LWZ2-11]